MTAHGFGVSLVSNGLATLAHEKVPAGGKLVDVARVRITDAGLDALKSE